MRFASTFSGIGGVDVGFAMAGWEPTLLCEIDPECRRVLALNFPDILLKGDIRDVTGDDLGQPDVFVGGFPCQETSSAAPNRLGLAGSRSGLFWEFRRLTEEVLPRWVVVENPTGLLTSPGRGEDGVDRTGWDAAVVFRELEELGYGWAYRVVDAQHLGSTQRRRRVLVVGHLGSDPSVAWSVLGDEGDGGTSASAGDHRRGPHGPGADQAAEGVGDVLIWRKSARARKSLAAGGYETWVPAEFANTLTCFDGGNAARQTHLVYQNGQLRTLTPIEWERLQGFPDRWTESMPVTSRFKALGNAVHTHTAAWLARRIQAVDDRLAEWEAL